MGQRTVLIRPDKKKVCPQFLAYYILAPKQQYELLGTANGATVAHVNIPIIRNMPVNLPTVSHLGKKHIDAIDLLVGPDELYVPFQNYFDKRQSLLNQNVLLLEARDRLLPRLMSGEVEV